MSENTVKTDNVNLTGASAGGMVNDELRSPVLKLQVKEKTVINLLKPSSNFTYDQV
jgi:hypothetical protein